MESRSPSQGTEHAEIPGAASATGRGRQRGVQRVVMAVRDLDAGKAFYSKLLDCEFLAADPADTEAFGVAVAISFDGGIELVAPVPGADSYVESILDARGEGLIGVVWAVADADACRDAAAELGVSAFSTIDYSQAEIDEKLQGRFSRYYEHFLAPAGPLGDAVVLVGEFDPV